MSQKERIFSNRVSTKTLSSLLSPFLTQLQSNYGKKGDQILESWPNLVGPEIAKMTQAVSFYEGVLSVVVKNSTLLSLLSQNEKLCLLKKLREKFPQTSIKNITFRM